MSIGLIWLGEPGAISITCPPSRRTSGAYSPIGSTMIIRSWGMVRNTFKSSRFAAKLLPEPVEPRYRPFADFSFFRSAMMTLWERAFIP